MRNILLGTLAVLLTFTSAYPQRKSGKTTPSLDELIVRDTREAVRAARKTPNQVVPAIQAIFQRADLQITGRQIAEAHSSLNAAERFLAEYQKSAKAPTVAPEALQGRLARIEGIELIDKKEYAEAEKKLREALDLSRKARDPVLEAGVHNNLGVALRYIEPGARNRLEQSAKEFEAARSMAEAQKDPLRAGSYNLNLGQVLLDLARPEEALEAFRRSAEQNKAASKPGIEARAIMFAGVSLSKINAVSDEPIKYFESAYRMFAGQNDERNAGWSCFLMAEHFAYGGKSREAAVAGERAVPLLLKVNDKTGLARCYTLLGEMYARLDDKAKSEAFRKKLEELLSGK